MSDIIAENQTEAVLSVLDRGEADNATRDKVSAALLRTQMKLLEDFAELKGHLWKPRDLEEMIDRRHEAACAACPARALQRQSKKTSLLELLFSSESIRYFILILILVWAVIYLKAGPDGVAAVRDAATSVVK